MDDETERGGIALYVWLPVLHQVAAVESQDNDSGMG